MNMNPRCCPGPGDLWQLAPVEEKRQAEYERLLEKFVEEFIPATGDPRLNEIVELGIEHDPEVDRLFDQFLKEHEC